ncbi:MAG: hypothetical protein M3O34_12100 [Chloroflexota bacterium]|nr:hypothetical protein [Chloroflexota bacterium]
MASFSDELNSMADRAREAEDTERRHRTQERERHEQAVDRARALEREIDAALDQAAKGDRYTLRVEPPATPYADARGWTVWWLEPQPVRGLELLLVHDDAKLRWAWIQDSPRPMRWLTEDVTHFTVERDLRNLLRRLADTEAWKSGRLP